MLREHLRYHQQQRVVVRMNQRDVEQLEEGGSVDEVQQRCEGCMLIITITILGVSLKQDVFQFVRLISIARTHSLNNHHHCVLCTYVLVYYTVEVAFI